MSASASEVERMEPSRKTAVRRRHAEEFRVEAVQYHRKARETDPRRTIRERAAELGISEKTFSDWVTRYEGAGKVARTRADEQAGLDEANGRVRELEPENEFLEKAAAFIAGSQARGTGSG